MIKYGLAIALLTGWTSLVGAHHGITRQFDTTQTLELTGTITKMRFVNPHSYVHFDVENAAGWIGDLTESVVVDRSFPCQRGPVVVDRLVLIAGGGEGDDALGSEVAVSGRIGVGDHAGAHVSAIERVCLNELSGVVVLELEFHDI